VTLCQIVGHAITATGHPSLAGSALVLCQRLDEAGRADRSPPVLAVDPLRAALHQLVLVTTDGSAAQEMLGDPHSPVRNSVVALVDEATP
jgi:microcompartment protein CcmK/EutM